VRLHRVGSVTLAEAQVSAVVDSLPLTKASSGIDCLFQGSQPQPWATL